MEATKHCGTCKTEKNASEFGRRAASADGLAAKCKDCQRDYDKERANRPERVAAREAYAQTDAGKQARKRARDKYAETHRKESAKRCKQYKEANPAKARAHDMVAYAIRTGALVKGDCEECGAPSDVAHHDDYARPLDVRWLCASHHRLWHSINGPGLNG